MGDPVLAAVAGFAAGAAEAGARVTLAGGTQLIAAAALLRHAEVDGRLSLVTTSFVADDRTTDLRRAADPLGLEVVVTDPGFDQSGHPALTPFARGEAKEGGGKGGALHFTDRREVPMRTVRARCIERYGAVVGLDGA